MAMSETDRDLIKSLADLLDENGLTEIEFEHKGRRVRVGRSSAPAGAAPAVPITAPPAEAAPPPPVASGADKADSSVKCIQAPMVGTFYSAPSPESEAFARVGDRVKKGQVICIIEAMKLMNEIESEHDGVVTERLVENGQGVEFGQALFEVKVD